MAGFIVDIPSEKKYWQFVLRAHGYKKAVHLDLLCQTEAKSLDGLTLPVRGKQFPREAENFKDFTKLTKDIVLPQIKDRVKTFDKWLTIPKIEHPIKWLYANGTIKAGMPGAPTDMDAYMYILDKGRIEYGAIKPEAKELFFHGKLLKGRFVVRQILNSPNYEKTGKKQYLRLFSKTKDDTPYVLDNRAVNKKWMPPLGVSALPEVWRRRIRVRYPYWLQKSKAQAIVMRNELVEALKKNELEMSHCIETTAQRGDEDSNTWRYERIEGRLDTNIDGEQFIARALGSTSPIEVIESKLSAKEGRYLWKGDIISEGVWSGYGLSVFWPKEVLWESIPLLAGVQVTYMSHSGAKVGEVVGAKRMGEGIEAWGFSSKDLTGFGLSVGTVHLSDVVRRKLYKILVYTEVAAVKSPACKVCYVKK